MKIQRCPKWTWLLMGFDPQTKRTNFGSVPRFEYFTFAVWPSNSWLAQRLVPAVHIELGACQMVASVHGFLQAASSDSLGTQWGPLNRPKQTRWVIPRTHRLVTYYETKPFWGSQIGPHDHCHDHCLWGRLTHQFSMPSTQLGSWESLCRRMHN